MIKERLSVRTAFLTSFVILSACLSASYSFGQDCARFEQIPITPSSQHTQTVFETPGTIIVIHGVGGAVLDSGKKAEAIKVEQSVTLPTWVNRATVFLNGWALSYFVGDHHVLGLATAIGKIRAPADQWQLKLTWNALGLLRDDDGEEGYNWSYRFTVIGWQSSNLDVVVDQGTVDANNQYCSPDGQITDNYFISENFGKPISGIDTDSALSSYSSFIQNTAFANSKTIVVLPRGFAFGWQDNDHHLLQLAYNLDHSEVFTEKDKLYAIKRGDPVTLGVSQVGSGFVSWDTYAILKDNDTKKNYYFAEVVSGMGGNDVGVVQPPFSIRPIENQSSFWGQICSGRNQVTTAEFVIENIPYQFAIPMLTGWELEYQQTCGDQHVNEIGMWIDSWTYEPPSGGAGGKLRYLSFVLHDEDNVPIFGTSHKVTVLGLRRVM